MSFVQAKCPLCGTFSVVDNTYKIGVCKACGGIFDCCENTCKEENDINTVVTPDVPETIIIPEIPQDYAPLVIPEIPEEYLNPRVPDISNKTLAQVDFPDNESSLGEASVVVYDVNCPCCGAEFQVSEKDFNKRGIACPLCKQPLEIDIEYTEEENNSTTNETTLEQIDFIPCNEYSSNVSTSNNFIISGGVLEKYIGSDSDVVIPDSVTVIEDFAFKDCISLISVTIPHSVTTIGECAFSDCKHLTSVTILNGVTNIGACAFADCTTLKSITIPDSVTSIGENVFSGCSNLITVTIPDSVIDVGNGAFFGCKNLTSVTLGNGISIIGDSTFLECSNLKNVTIGNGVTYIGECAFGNCFSLESIVIPFSVARIGTCAFAFCSKLKDVTLSRVGATIAGDAFKGTPFNDKLYAALEEIKKSEQKSTEIRQTDFMPSSNANTDIQIKASSDFIIEGTVLKKYVGEESYVVVPDGVTKIGDGAFRDCSPIGILTLPNTLTEIGNEAFARYFVASVTIPESVTHIGNRAFESCFGVKSVVLPNAKHIGDGAFLGCTELNSVFLPSSASVGNAAFAEYWEKNYLCTCCGGALINKRCVKCGWVRTY